MHNTFDVTKVPLASFIWNVKPFNGSVGTSRIMKSPNGQIFSNSFCTDLALVVFDEFTGALTKIRQIGTVREYQTKFENLVKHIEGFSDAFYRSCFISDIKDTI